MTQENKDRLLRLLQQHKELGIVEQMLIRLCNKIPFDDRICQQASLDDFDMIYIRDFLREQAAVLRIMI